MQIHAGWYLEIVHSDQHQDRSQRLVAGCRLGVRDELTASQIVARHALYAPAETVKPTAQIGGRSAHRRLFSSGIDYFVQTGVEIFPACASCGGNPKSTDGLTLKCFGISAYDAKNDRPISFKRRWFPDEEMGATKAYAPAFQVRCLVRHATLGADRAIGPHA